MLFLLLSCGDPPNIAKANPVALEEDISYSIEPTDSLSIQREEVREAREDLQCIKQYLHTEQVEDYEEYEKINCLK